MYLVYMRKHHVIVLLSTRLLCNQASWCLLHGGHTSSHSEQSR